MIHPPMDKVAYRVGLSVWGQLSDPQKRVWMSASQELIDRAIEAEMRNKGDGVAVIVAETEAAHGTTRTQA